mmetsp:Transcript_1244/g.1894  ORF Transcript_1244/g.1894 Transcript_1244/m.1894 type:complete len:1084 (-) Transcript_1244:75-3326(-)|eukprot:CAMPEP_0194216418 /NCGR_PEP_ID=MMETSP0156-20130528/18925_1 /TAXON_ID=33649 /ORGANISM="Thalassionema nitzschioides, Strain L26-B" /LENGTH=1083 /DNA_ID=CAMNT_0038945181 /DNA_START=133 /DNA_END=3384 /DNA_ORIENTATION=-
MESRTLQLAVVERKLLEDEGSSLDSWTANGNNSLCTTGNSSYSNSPSAVYRGQADCETPPRLERTHKGEYAKIRETATRKGTKYSFDSPLRDAEAVLASHFDIPRILGMHELATERHSSRRKLECNEDDDTLSFSDESVDSVELLQRRALEIRHELRIRELTEIAHVAERAAAEGHDSFAGQASTFIGDVSNHVTSAPELKSVPMKRNATYTEGYKRRSIAKPLLRRAKTENKRKIPVMALRHIDDLIPPMQQLHNHLRAHFSMSGVDTENSFVEEAILTTSLEKDEQFDHGVRNDASSDIGFIAKMREWVTKPTTSTNTMSEEKYYEYQASDGKNDVNPETAFESGDTLSEHITSTAIARGQWKPSPVKIPDGIAAHAECISTASFATPRRRPSFATLWKNFGSTPQETSVTTAVTSSISSEVADADQQQADFSDFQTNNQESGIIPVALFDSDEDDEDESCNDQIAECELGSKHFPKPFDIQTWNKEKNHQSPPRQRERRRIIEPPSPNSMPGLFITPVRLKGIRHVSLRRSGSCGRSSLVWGGFTRADSFLSDSGLGTPVRNTVGSSRGNFVDDGKLGKLDSSTFSSKSGATSFLKPSCPSANATIDAITGDAVMSSETNYHVDIQTKASRTKMASESFEERRQEVTDTRSQDDQIENTWKGDSVIMTPTKNVREPSSFNIGIIPTATALTHESTLQHSDAVENVQQSNSSVTTPMPEGCECMQLDSSIKASKQSRAGIGCKTDIEDLSKMTPIAFRRVTSCPSPAEALSNKKIVTATPNKLREGSLLKVFKSLSPSTRTRSASRIGIRIQDNHDYLNNYLYFNKPSSLRTGPTMHDQAARPLCIEPCEINGSCEKNLPVSCEALSAVSDTACVLFKRPENDCKDLIQTTNDYAGFEPSAQDNWFDLASARFDIAIEQLVGAARHNPHSRWGEAFHAPTLTIKTPQHGHRKNNPRTTKEDELSGCYKDVPNEVVEEEGQMMSQSDSPVPFPSVYGMSRDDFRNLSKDKRLAVWQGHHHPIIVPEIASSGWSPPRRPQHKATFSTSDISEIWVQAQTNDFEKKSQNQTDVNEIETSGKTSE